MKDWKKFEIFNAFSINGSITSTIFSWVCGSFRLLICFKQPLAFSPCRALQGLHGHRAPSCSPSKASEKG
jgi:hypothetical protein